MPKKNKPQEPKGNLSRKTRKFLLLTLIAYIVLSLLLFDLKLFTGGDNAKYIILAQSIIEGKGYKDVYMPEEPAHTQYPFGFPLLLAFFLLIFGSNIVALKSAILLTGLGAVYFMYKISEDLFRDKTNLIMLFFISVPVFITYNHWVLSEMPFLFFSLGGLLFFVKAQTGKKFYYYVSFFFAIYAFFIRTSGVSLIIAMLLLLVLKKQYRYLTILLLVFLAVFIPWQIRNASVPTQDGYINQLLAKNPYQMELGRIGLSDFMSRAWDNFVLYYFTILPMTLLPFFRSAGLLAISGLTFILLTIIGFIKKIKSLTIIELYFILGTIILLAWPKVWSSDRFILPLLPIFIIYIFFAIVWLAEKLKSKYLPLVIIGIFIILNAMAIVPMARDSIANNLRYLKGDKYAGYTTDWRRYFELIEWIKENIPKGQVVMARKPEFVFLLSKHKSFTYPLTTDHNKIKDAITKTDYVLFDNFFWTGTTQRYLLPVIQEAPENYEIVYQTKKPEFFLLKVKK